MLDERGLGATASGANDDRGPHGNPRARFCAANPQHARTSRTLAGVGRRARGMSGVTWADAAKKGPMRRGGHLPRLGIVAMGLALSASGCRHAAARADADAGTDARAGHEEVSLAPAKPAPPDAPQLAAIA